MAAGRQSIDDVLSLTQTGLVLISGLAMTSLSSNHLSTHSRRRWFGLLLLCVGLLANVGHGAALPAHWLAAELVGPEQQLVLANKELRLRLAPVAQVAGQDVDGDDGPDGPILVGRHPADAPFLRAAGQRAFAQSLPVHRAALVLPPVRAPPQP